MRSLISAWMLVVLFTGFSAWSFDMAPRGFEQAKMILRTAVYHDQTNNGDFYCGCNWTWNSRKNSGGRTDLQSCGYEARSPSQLSRAQRIEWEHIMPAHSFGQHRQCWKDGGRSNCASTDPVFSRMEADMHNLTVAVGEVNGDRSNFRFSVLPGTPKQHGQCDVKIDFKQRAAEPRDEVKGMAARVYFYMHDQYGLSMSRQQSQLFRAWDKMYPVTQWERERDRRIARFMGRHNPFVTGEKQWTESGSIHSNSFTAPESSDYERAEPYDDEQSSQYELEDNPANERDIVMRSSSNGVSFYPRAGKPDRLEVAEENKSESFVRSAEEIAIDNEEPIHIAPIYGNKQSKIYHTPDCPAYNKVAERNRVIFHKEEHALLAGFRKAGNCPQ